MYLLQFSCSCAFQFIHVEWLELGTDQLVLSSPLLSVVKEGIHKAKEGRPTYRCSDLAPLGRSEVEVIEEKKILKGMMDMMGRLLDCF